MKSILLIVFSSTIAVSALAASLNSGPEVDPANQSTQMVFARAAQLCASKGARLPTPREWGHYAMSFGAKGFRETRYPNRPAWSNEVVEEERLNRLEGYKPQFDFKSGNLSYEYYYSSDGFSNPATADLDMHVCDFAAEVDACGVLKPGYYLEKSGSVSNSSSSYFHLCSARCTPL